MNRNTFRPRANSDQDFWSNQSHQNRGLPKLTSELPASDLFRRCGYVYVNLLVAIKEPAAKHKQSSNNHDHEDHQHGHYSRTSSTTIVSHKTFLLYMKLGCNQPGSPRCFLSRGGIAPK